MGCDYGHFTKQWKVTEVDGGQEREGHLISISGFSDDVKIECRNDPNHLYSSAKYNEGRIEARDGSWVIDCIEAHKKIRFQRGLPTGSWTAEDNGGTGGEG